MSLRIRRLIAIPFILALLSLSLACDMVPLNEDPYVAGEKAYEKEKAYREGVEAARQKDLAEQKEAYIEEYGHRLEDYCTANHVLKAEREAQANSEDARRLARITDSYRFQFSYVPPRHRREEIWAKEYCGEHWVPGSHTPNSIYEYFVQDRWDVLHETICPLTGQLYADWLAKPSNSRTRLNPRLDYPALQDAGLRFGEVYPAVHFCENHWVGPTSTGTSDSSEPPPFIITIGDATPNR